MKIVHHCQPAVYMDICIVTMGIAICAPHMFPVLPFEAVNQCYFVKKFIIMYGFAHTSLNIFAHVSADY